MRESFTVPVGSADLAADRWSGSGPTVVLLHAGVADRRGWYGVADRLGDVGQVVAFDRRSERPGVVACAYTGSGVPRMSSVRVHSRRAASTSRPVP